MKIAAPTFRSIGEFAIRALSVAVGLYALCLIGLYLFQSELIFHPDRHTKSPSEAGLADAVDVTLHADDGSAVGAWFVTRKDLRLILFVHPKGASLARFAATIDRLAALGPNVLALDYCGFGATEGALSEDNTARDVKAAYDYARASGFRAQDIVVVGQSFGTGLAVRLAAENPVGGFVLDSPYSSVADVAAARFWMFPVRLLIRDAFDAVSRVSSVRAPILIMLAGRDRTTPFWSGAKLTAAADKPALYVEPEAGHILLRTDAAWKTLADWLATLPNAPSTTDAAP